MNPISLSLIKPEVYQQWLNKQATQRLLALEAGWLRNWVNQLYGYHLAYCGIDTTPHFLKYSKTRHTFRFGFKWSEQIVPCDALVEEGQWPLADEAVDVVILQHSLDMSRSPHQLLKEASRSLGAGGYLIIVGFNPYSLFGAMRWLKSFSSKLPWLMRPLSKQRVTDWLQLLDMHVEHTSDCAHLWPIYMGTETLSRQVDRVLVGTSWLPANAYLLVARKTIAGMTPICQNKKTYRQPSFGMPVAAATTVQPTLNNEK